MLSSTNHLFSNSPTSQIAPPVPQDTSKHLYHTAPDPNWFVFPVTPKEILWPFPPQIWGHHKWREVTERVLSNSLSLGLQASPQLLESHRLTRKCHWCHRLIRLDTSVSYYCPSLLPKLQHCTKNQENLREIKTAMDLEPNTDSRSDRPRQATECTTASSFSINTFTTCTDCLTVWLQEAKEIRYVEHIINSNKGCKWNEASSFSLHNGLGRRGPKLAGGQATRLTWYHLMVTYLRLILDMAMPGSRERQVICTGFQN